MKGVVFVALAEMIQDKFGHKAWNEILDSSELPSKGVYTSAANYDDQEAINLLGTISKKLEKTVPDVLKVFGVHLLKYFAKKYPYFFENKNFFEFLQSIDEVVHLEIKKISPDSVPPKILTKIIVPNKEMQVSYFSKRKLCPLAIGLIKGASYYYGENVEIKHLCCTNDGFDHCEFLIKVK